MYEEIVELVENSEVGHPIFISKKTENIGKISCY